MINVRELKNETKKVLGSLLLKLKGPIVVTRRGRPIALIRSLSSKELDVRFGSLWDRIRVAAESAGYKPKDVRRLVSSVRSRGGVKSRY